jgi:hypothetical protein
MRQVVKDRFHAFSTPFEGRRYHMYRDTKGFVTTGVGNLLKCAPVADCLQAACALPFKPDGVGAPASATDIESAFDLVKAAPPGLPTAKSGNDAYGKLTNLRLNDQDVDALVDSALTRFDGDLALRFAINGTPPKYPPSYQSYANFCADAQLGLLSMQWPGSFNDFVTFQAAVRVGNWFTAAKQCYFDVTDNLGIVERNRANRWLFSVAGRMERFSADPNELHYGPQDAPGLNKAFLLRGAQCIRYDWNDDHVDSGPLGNYFKLPAPFDTGVTAAFNGYGNEKVPEHFGKTFFVKGPDYVRYDWDTDTVDAGPLPLTTWGLTGDFAQGVDAAVNGYGGYQGKLYFFKGDKYVSFDWARNKIDRGPSSIADGWDVPVEFQAGVDAVVSGEGPYLNKLYFLKDDKYVRFRWGPTYKQDGPVKYIQDGWIGTAPLQFAYGIDAIVNPPGRG